jgi:uncharacterized protein
MNVLEKEKALIELLREKESVAIAFSGGVDSTYLLDVANGIPGLNVVAITAKSPLHAKDEGSFADRFCTERGIEHVMIDMPLLQYKEIRENSPKRCYYCKKVIFSALKSRLGEEYVLADGTNLDDFNDYRPGLQACEELSVWHPLSEAKLAKSEIYELSKIRRLETSDKPPFACLASRIPYGHFLTKDNLEQVEEAEKFIQSLGFKQYRVRHHGEIARIELLPHDIGKLLDESIRLQIDNKLKSLGFSYVALDLKGYKTGSMNIGVKK